MRAIIVSVLTLSLISGLAPIVLAQSGPPRPDAIWADGILFGVVLTPNSLPPHGPKDGLFNFSNSGLTGQRAVSETKPGDRDYNGGRWQVTFVAYTPSGISYFDPDGDGAVNMEMTSWEEVQQHISAGHLEITGQGPSFTCPLIPQH
jgi:hypothetical protein